MGLFGGSGKSSGPFQFRISDAVEVPARGYLLRLKLLSGEPSLSDLAVGKNITLRRPDGTERVVAIKDHSLTQGPATQKRLDRTREFDVIIAMPDAVLDGSAVDTGWTASGPAESS
jgi:hypothetical protein